MNNEITSEQMRAMAQSLSLPATYRSPFYGIDKICRDASIMLDALAAEREQSPCSLNEALAVIEQWELQGYTLQGDDGDRLHALADKIAPREQSPAVVTDEMVEVACLAFFVDASWKEYEKCHSRVRPSVESDMRAALEAIVPLLQSPAV